MRTVLFVPDTGLPELLAATVYEKFWGELLCRYRLPDFRVDRCPLELSAEGAILRLGICRYLDRFPLDEAVVLVGCGKGGVACRELLLSTPLRCVKHLVTMGSEAPLLTGRLRNHRPGQFPPWTHFYRPGETLGFIKNSMPGASRRNIVAATATVAAAADVAEKRDDAAYWDDPCVYDEIITIVDSLGGAE